MKLFTATLRSCTIEAELAFQGTALSTLSVFRAAVQLKIIIAINRTIEIFAINRTRIRNTSLWHRIPV